ncbi:hypothetical protein RUND412_004927 [Rhizina undulata]
MPSILAIVLFNPVPTVTQLALDEQSTAHGKLNIASFGCTWILPLGVQITLQDEIDEIAEREEVEAQYLHEDTMARVGQLSINIIGACENGKSV